MHNQFKAISLSYKNAPLEIRELVSFDESSTKRFLGMLEDYSEVTEALVISTCNRTEVYYSADTDQSASILKLIGVVKGLETGIDLSKYFIVFNDHTAAVRHLFNVSIGLESQVVGDLQIINQVKLSYQWAADENIAGPFIHRLMHTIFFTNKRVVQETSFRDGAASVSYATVELIQELTTALERPKILVLGLGEIGQDVARNLEHIDDKEVKVCNRSISKANTIATELDFEVVNFEKYTDAIQWADVIISSISTDQPLITKSIFIEGLVHSHKYIFDLSVPRSVEDDIESINGLLLYNIDNIQNKASEALEKRKASIPGVIAIIDEVMKEFDNWAQEMEVSPVINKLKNALEDIRKNEIARYVKNTNSEDTALVDKVTKSMMQKIIKLPVLQLKAACKRGEADSLIEVLNDLFDLENKEEKVEK
ncbi:MAG: glutamyl-tRNA reductase [Reichenbachiella sp.]